MMNARILRGSFRGFLGEFNSKYRMAEDLIPSIEWLSKRRHDAIVLGQRGRGPSMGNKSQEVKINFNKISDHAQWKIHSKFREE